jgi:hypothetical protein
MNGTIFSISVSKKDMGSHSRRTAALMIAIFVAEAVKLFAQNVSPHLEIRTLNNQSTFHLGERYSYQTQLHRP